MSTSIEISKAFIHEITRHTIPVQYLASEACDMLHPVTGNRRTRETAKMLKACALLRC